MVLVGAPAGGTQLDERPRSLEMCIGLFEHAPRLVQELHSARATLETPRGSQGHTPTSRQAQLGGVAKLVIRERARLLRVLGTEGQGQRRSPWRREWVAELQRCEDLPGGSQIRDLVVYGVMILILLIRPQGILGGARADQGQRV